MVTNGGSITFTGLSSGIDTGSIVTQLIAVESAPKTLLMNQQDDREPAAAGLLRHLGQAADTEDRVRRAARLLAVRRVAHRDVGRHDQADGDGDGCRGRELVQRRRVEHRPRAR